MKSLEEIGTKLEALETRSNELLQTAEETPAKVGEIQELLKNEIQPQIATLTAERDQALQVEGMKAMRGEIETLQNVITKLRETPDFTIGRENASGPTDEGKAANYGEDGKFSIFADIKSANKGLTDARERLLEGFDADDLTPEGKAMTEGVQAQGGYLVQPVIERQIVEAIELDNVLRGLCSKINVTTNAIQLDQLTLSTTAGWVAELAQKPETTGMSIASVTASVFTAAGLATVSNQLLADSNPGVDALVTADLVKRLTALEEAAFINGSGSGQPLGILNTPGVSTTALTSTTETDLLDAILDAIANVETNHGAPSAILMHPRTWTRILKSQDANGAYYIAPSAPGESSVVGPRTVVRGPVKTLWGYPVVTSNRLPTNLGAGTNESRVIVADFREALILDRQGVTVDESAHVYFTSNQTVFRAEKRLGFTAARTPQAFNVIGGAGLANG